MNLESRVYYPGKLEVVRGAVGVEDLPMLSAEIDSLWNTERGNGHDGADAIVGVAEITSIMGLASVTKILRGVVEDFEVPIDGEAFVSSYISRGGGKFSMPGYGTVLSVTPAEGLNMEVSLHGKTMKKAKLGCLELEVNPGDVVLSSGMMFQRRLNTSDKPVKDISFIFGN